MHDAYLAGHFDGEGCVLMRKHNKLVRLEIIVAVSHKPVTEAYLSRFGGGIIQRPSVSVNKLIWTWRLIKQSEIVGFIDSVLPYSMEKKAQLLLARKWLVTRLADHPTQPSKETREYAQVVNAQLKALKKVS